MDAARHRPERVAPLARQTAGRDSLAGAVRGWPAD